MEFRPRAIDRRFLIAAAASAVCAPSSVLARDDEDWRIIREQALEQGAPVTLGRLVPPADDASWREVAALIAGAPDAARDGRRPTPFEVARYLVTAVPDTYRMAWPEPNPAHPTYANPLILWFFGATKTHPQGDETAWCAAFVNWCLKRAGVQGTGSAASQSFLKSGWGHAVWRDGESDLPDAARPGDIAVFRTRYDTGHGHVGFFAGISKTRAKSIEVLGGNQLTGHGRARRHLIDIDTFRVDRELQLVAVLTAPGLRRA
jgi:uncharacterized protein (TIGR02594 family)